MKLTFAALAAALTFAPFAAAPALTWLSANSVPVIYRSPDGNTITIGLFNTGIGDGGDYGGSSGARTAYRTLMWLNGGRYPSEPLVDTGAMGLCVGQGQIDDMLSGVDSFGKPTLLPSDYRGRTIVETASGQKLIRDRWNIREVHVLGFDLHNVEAVSCGSNIPLLGQGILARFKSWSIDNEKGTITVVGPPINGKAPQ